MSKSKELTVNNIADELDEIVGKKYFDRIGEIGEKNYNEDLDNICCDILDVVYKIRGY